MKKLIMVLGLVLLKRVTAWVTGMEKDAADTVGTGVVPDGTNGRCLEKIESIGLFI